MEKNQEVVKNVYDGKLKFSVNGGVRITTTKRNGDGKDYRSTENVEFDNLTIDVEFDSITELKEILSVAATSMFSDKESKQPQPRKREEVVEEVEEFDF